MFVDFFIRRPVFAGVVAIIIALLGAISIPGLPISQYPSLAPPQVTVTATYIGASAEVVEATVTTPLEEAINGSPGMMYMSSTTTNSGLCTITVTYSLETDQSLAAVDVENRIQTVLPVLPMEVKQTGVIVTKTSAALVSATGFYAEHGEYDNLFISNYVDVQVVDALSRVPGVSEVRVFGERKYAMRVWLDPVRLAARGLTATDVLSAIGEQNAEIAAGSVGAPPSLADQTFEISVRAVGRLTSAAEFGDIVVKRGATGSATGGVVRLRDVGRVELGAEDYSTNLRFNGHLAVGVGIFQYPEANALDVDRGVRETLARLSKSFPPGMKYVVSLDTTTIIGESIRDVLYTLAIAIVLVIAVIYFFLQSARTTVIPAITIPVSLIGTFIFIHLFHFSINTLTLFGLTLATGLVVDDAIVVIENIERHTRLEHESPRHAASVAMGEVVGAVIATSLVLIAVFIPVALISGTTGILYKQFSLTIAFSIALSAFNALTLTPSLSALLVRPAEKHGRFFSWVNRTIDRFTEAYKRWLARIFRFRWLVVLGFVAALAATWWLWITVPRGFVPSEDQSYLMVTVQAPDGASLDYTTGIVEQVEGILRGEPDVTNIFSVIGFSFTGSGSNKAMLFPSLKPISARHGSKHSAAAIVGRLVAKLAGIPGALVVPFEPPAIRGVGNFGGFQFEVEQRGTSGSLSALALVARQLMVEGNRSPALRGVFTAFTANAPQLVLTVDRDKAKSLGVPLTEVQNALAVFMASVYVNDFTLGARSYRVYAQGDTPYRSQPEALREFYVRNQQGQLLPLAGLVKIAPTTTATLISHYNLFRNAEVNGTAAPGHSSGEAITTMEQLAARIFPRDMGYEWSGLAREEIQSGHKTIIIFALGIVFVFLVLAAQYESFLLPFIIMLAVPLAILGALVATWLRGLVSDVFTQVGLVMLIGLASKNAILIVEFAEQLRAHGRTVVEAAIEASGIRLRPILMTSFAFILGVLPLVFATGAGAHSRQSLGTAVFGGMIVSTVLNLLIIPVLYVVIQGWRERHGAKVRE